MRMQAGVSMWKKWIYRVIIYRGILVSQKTRSLFADHLIHTMDLLFARPVVVVGISGFAGGTLGFHYSYLFAIIVFLLILLSLFFLQSICLPDPDTFRTRVVILSLAAVFGIYSLSLITFQRTKAGRELQTAISEDLYGESIYNESTNSEFVNSESTYEGYIISISLPDETYKTYTLLWKNGVKVRFGSCRTDLAYGQHVRICGTISLVPEARNPGGFDQKMYYARQGIFLSLDTYDDNIFIKKDSSVIPGLFEKLELMGLKLRRDITSMWNSVLGKDDAALLSGMILGDTSQMSDELKRAFRMCNLSHLTAVSGANVSYFLIPISAFIQMLSGRRRIRQALVFVFLIFFGFLTGWTASVTRALFMSVGTLFSSVLMKRHDPVSAMFLTSCVLIFNNPFVAVDLGFLLSFSATLSLFLFAEKMTEYLAFLPGKGAFSQAAACLVCTQIGMLPWLILLSGKQSVLLFFTNLAGSFLSEGISLLSLPLSGFLLAAMAAPILMPLVKILFLPLAGLLYVLSEMAYLCSEHTIQALRLYSVHPLLLFSISALILAFLLPRGFLSRNLRRIMCLFLMAGLALQIYSYLNRPMGTVIFVDVGQGDSALVILDNNMSILIDGGDIGSGEDVLIPLLNYYGIDKPDITILTHLHSDHGSGIIELIGAGRVSDVLTPCILPGKELSDLFMMEEDNRVNLHSIEKDDKIVLSSTAELFFLSPQTLREEGGNEDSAVVLLQIGSTGILFMGDAGESTEELLLQKQTVDILEKYADFIKIGHHGSKFSSTQVFLSRLSLQAAVISVGENNYGHPTAETLNRLAEQNVDIFRTDESGAVIIEIEKNISKIYEYSS